MPLPFAMPLLHKNDEADYATFYNTIGENILTFYQPVRLEAGADGSDKLELGFAGGFSDEVTQEAQTLYAMLPGILSTQQEDGQTNLVLEFRSPGSVYSRQARTADASDFMRVWDQYLQNHTPASDSDTLSWLCRLNKSTLQLKKAVYFQVDTTIVRQKMTELLSSAEYAQFVSGNHFLQTRVRVDNGTKSLQQAIRDGDNLIDGFMNGDSELPVNAGMAIGAVDTRFSLGFYDGANRPLNPIYLFRLLCKWRNFAGSGSDPWIDFRETYMQDDFMNVNCFHGDCLTVEDIIDIDIFDYVSHHPLLWLLRNNSHADYLQHLNAPLGRYVYEQEQRIQNNAGEALLIEPYWQLFVPPAHQVDRVSEHQNNDVSTLVDYDRADGVPSDATHAWRVTDAGYIVYRRKLSEPGTRYPFHEEAYFCFEQSAANVIENQWQNFSDITNEAGGEFDIPCELLIAMVAKESTGRERACGVEPWPNQDLNGPCQTNFNNYCNLTHNQTTGNRVRKDCTVPDPYGNEVVRSRWDIRNGQTQVPGYTWNDLLADVDTPNSPLARRVSPGLVQQLLSTAEELLQRYNTRISNLEEVTNVPGQNRTYADVFDWLLTGEHSIAMAAAYILQRIDGQNVGYDPFKLRITYFAGSLRDSTQQLFGYIASSAILNGHTGSSSFLSYYNACIYYFNDKIGDTNFTQPNTRLQSV